MAEDWGHYEEDEQITPPPVQYASSSFDGGEGKSGGGFQSGGHMSSGSLARIAEEQKGGGGGGGDGNRRGSLDSSTHHHSSNSLNRMNPFARSGTPQRTGSGNNLMSMMQAEESDRSPSTSRTHKTGPKLKGSKSALSFSKLGFGKLFISTKRTEHDLHYGTGDMTNTNTNEFGRTGSNNSLSSFDRGASSSSKTETSGSFDGKPLREGPPPSPEADADEYTVCSGLGQGGYSQVVLVRDPVAGGFAAMKVIDKMKLNRSRDRTRLRNELWALTQMTPSPFLLQLRSAFESPYHIYFVTDFLSGGDLFYHLTHSRDTRGTDGLGEEAASFILAECVLGLKHMHGHSMIHRDIKVENIMLTTSGHVKLIDFGLCTEIKQEVSEMSPTGSLIYMAPELLEGNTGGRHTDWWAMGVLSHELITGRVPWSSLTNKKVVKSEIKALDVSPPVDASFAAGMFIISLLNRDIKKRAGSKNGAAELMQSPFFKHIDWKALEQGQVRPVLVPKEVFPFPPEECDDSMNCFMAGQTKAANAKVDVTTSYWGGLEQVEEGPRRVDLPRKEIERILTEASRFRI